jgi:hypothetical protein
LPAVSSQLETGPEQSSGTGRQPICTRGARRYVGQCGAQCFLLNDRNNLSSRPALSLFCSGENCSHVEVVLGGLFLAKTPHFLHNVIIGHGKLP